MNEREQAAEGAAILQRLVPTSKPGQRRDPVTGFTYYSAGWLSDSPPLRLVPDLQAEPRRFPAKRDAPAPTKGV